jgi:serine/threonine-protein kinase HipA
MTSERAVYIHIQLPGSLQVVPAARLAVETLPDGREIGRFRYGDRYLARPQAVALDPFVLPLSDEVYEFTALHGIPGAVRDAAPDGWGRRVIEHRLQRLDLAEIDYLINGPQEGAGNLMFGSTRQPPTTTRYNQIRQLAELAAAVEAIEAGRPLSASLAEMLQPGTSMGGARPKASIEDGGVLWLGKFPSRDDRIDYPRIEHATLELARRCGLDVAESRLQSLGERNLLLVKRFDRACTDGGYLRHGFVSALTALRCEDDFSGRERWSYPLLADALRRWSEDARADCRELFRRMVFNAAVTNNDDHPRNHALIHRERGWRLSPAYDLVPTPLLSLERRDLAMAVGERGRAADVDNLVSQCGRFGLSSDEAKAEIRRIVEIVRVWREVFAEVGVAATDIEAIAPAFLPDCFFAPGAQGA